MKNRREKEEEQSAQVGIVILKNHTSIAAVINIQRNSRNSWLTNKTVNNRLSNTIHLKRKNKNNTSSGLNNQKSIIHLIPTKNTSNLVSWIKWSQPMCRKDNNQLRARQKEQFVIKIIVQNRCAFASEVSNRYNWCVLP